MFSNSYERSDLIKGGLEDKAKRTRGTSSETPCSFYSEPTDHDREEIADLASGPAIAIDDEDSTSIIRETASAEILEVWPWVNQVSSQECLSRPLNLKPISCFCCRLL